MAKSHGDYLFEHQLVDREFYKRERIMNQSKKDGRMLDQFEQKMRDGRSNRRGARRKEFLEELMTH